MKLPNCENAIVDRAKITGYLLLEDEEAGNGKAGFFTRFGFSMAEWEVLTNALLSHARTYDVNYTETTHYGEKYIIEGPLDTPDGRHPPVRSIWLIEHGQTTARLITAYPVKRKSP